MTLDNGCPKCKFKLNTDGSKRSSWLMAAAGGLVWDHLGNWIFGYRIKIKPMDSFTSELWGSLKEGLRLVKDNDLVNVEVELDSEAVVKALNKDLNSTQAICKLFLDCKNLLENRVFIKV